jgi:hypothetical protein
MKRNMAGASITTGHAATRKRRHRKTRASDFVMRARPVGAYDRFLMVA